MVQARCLPRTVVAAIDASKILGIRAGVRSDHRFTGVWPVVVEGRVFVRSWTLKPDGWYRTFLGDPLGTLQVGERQVRVRGKVARMPFEESARYFGQRPRESQMSAAVSPQSEVIESRSALEERVRDLARRVGDGPVPVPHHWAGYRLAPSEVEFWQGRESRLHDRFRYVREGQGYRIERLAP